MNTDPAYHYMQQRLKIKMAELQHQAKEMHATGQYHNNFVGDWLKSNTDYWRKHMEREYRERQALTPRRFSNPTTAGTSTIRGVDAPTAIFDDIKPQESLTDVLKNASDEELRTIINEVADVAAWRFMSRFQSGEWHMYKCNHCTYSTGDLAQMLGHILSIHKNEWDKISTVSAHYHSEIRQL